jgi:hypothetical protein
MGLEIDGMDEWLGFVVEDDGWVSRDDGRRDARTGLFADELLLVEEDAERLWVGRGVA